MTEEKIKAALVKVSAEGVPAVTVVGNQCVLNYGAAHYETRATADFAALATVCSVGASSVVETPAPRAQSDVATIKPVAQTVTVAIRPLAEKK
jgi:uncharacterized protein YjlB